MEKRPFGRVDFQVSVLTASMVLLSTLLISLTGYRITYNDMIAALCDRVRGIYEYVDPLLDKSGFKAINTKEDIQKEDYKYYKSLLEEAKNITGVKYLYTAKENEDGELIYVIDGLSMEEDFRYPGDKIEPEIQEDLRRALRGEEVWPDKIKMTDWGKIFIAYLPIHGEKPGETIGAIGIEFEAEQQYSTYRNLRLLIPIVSLGACLISIVIAVLIFQRMSNPLYKDMANIDFATKLKSRNAFEIDLHNLNAKAGKEDIGIISIDLNYLKLINDALGHVEGDRYINLSASIIKKACHINMAAYRVGGDEFVVLAKQADIIEMKRYIDTIYGELEKENTMEGLKLSLSAGYAIYESGLDEDLFDTYKRADRKMYEEKKRIKEGKKTIDFYSKL